VDLLKAFSMGKSFDDYTSDALLRSAVERQFEIVGEALNNLSKVDAQLASSIPDLRRIVAFRNVLIHGYATIDDALVWQVLSTRVPALDEVLNVSLARGGTGQGRVTSQPAGIDCTYTTTSTIGTCVNAFYPVGTQVRLEARPAAGSQFLGWAVEKSCPDAPDVTVLAGVAHICRPVFRLR
jgi:uncharacterized protein with HEPN domain